MTLYAIKPLKWKLSSSDKTWSAGNDLISYYVSENHEGSYKWTYSLNDSYRSSCHSHCANTERGKELAQEHWVETVKKFLIEVN